MADWTSISNANVEPDAPWISATAFALRDNPIAIAEGALGAPRIQNAAVANGVLGAEKFQGGTAERDWVLARTAAASVGAVGTYAMLKKSSLASPENTPGQTEAGSALRYTAALSSLVVGSTPSSDTISSASATAPAGTWRCMGETSVDSSDNLEGRFLATLWLRIS